MNNQTFGDALAAATTVLNDASIDTARLDALVLLEHVTSKDRSLLLARPEDILPANQAKLYKKCIHKRSFHTPVSYITGTAEFYGNSFFVNEHVLVPRSESEALVELFLELPHTQPVPVLDVGTGSGALAISIKLACSEAAVTALDIDPNALAVARKNAQTHGAAISFMRSDLLEQIATAQADVIIANLPYVPKDYPINQAAAHEPPLALFGGNDGLDLYRKLFEQLSGLAGMPQFVLCESLETQHKALADIAGQCGYVLRKTKGLAQLFTRVESPA